MVFGIALDLSALSSSSSSSSSSSTASRAVSLRGLFVALDSRIAGAPVKDARVRAARGGPETASRREMRTFLRANAVLGPIAEKTHERTEHRRVQRAYARACRRVCEVTDGTLLRKIDSPNAVLPGSTRIVEYDTAASHAVESLGPCSIELHSKQSRASNGTTSVWPHASDKARSSSLASLPAHVPRNAASASMSPNDSEVMQDASVCESCSSTDATSSAVRPWESLRTTSMAERFEERAVNRRAAGLGDVNEARGFDPPLTGARGVDGGSEQEQNTKQRAWQRRGVAGAKAARFASFE